MDKVLCSGCLQSFEQGALDTFDADGKLYCDPCMRMAVKRQAREGAAADLNKPTSYQAELRQEVSAIRKQPFMQVLMRSFSYPFRGWGIAMLAMGSLASAFLIMLPAIGTMLLVKMLLLMLLSCYFCAYLNKAIRFTVNGEKDPPPWPEVMDIWDDVARPGFMVFTIFVFYGLPAGIWFYCCLPDGLSSLVMGESLSVVQIIVVFVLLCVGSLFVPMAIISVALLNSLRGMNPFFVLGSIMKIKGPYLLVWGALLLAILVSGVLGFLDQQGWLEIGLVLGEVLGLYFMVVQARMLGVTYLYHRRKLAWFGEEMEAHYRADPPQEARAEPPAELDG